MPRRPTANDELIARWATRWAPVTVSQIAARFARSWRTAYRRVEALRNADLLRLEPQILGLPGVLYPGPPLRSLPTGPRLAPVELYNHLGAVQRAIALELDGHELLPAHELQQHPGLLDQLPHLRDRPLIPAFMVAKPPHRIIYAAMRSGDEDRRLRDRLASSRWPAPLPTELIIDAAHLHEAEGLPEHLKVVTLDLPRALSRNP